MVGFPGRVCCWLAPRQGECSRKEQNELQHMGTRLSQRSPGSITHHRDSLRSWFSPFQSPGNRSRGGLSETTKLRGGISTPKRMWCSPSHGEMLQPNTSWQKSSFSLLSKTTQSRDHNFRGQGGSLPTAPAVGVTQPHWDTQGSCYSLELYREM